MTLSSRARRALMRQKTTQPMGLPLPVERSDAWLSDVGRLHPNTVRTSARSASLVDGKKVPVTGRVPPIR